MHAKKLIFHFIYQQETYQNTIEKEASQMQQNTKTTLPQSSKAPSRTPRKSALECTDFLNYSNLVYFGEISSSRDINVLSHELRL